MLKFDYQIGIEETHLIEFNFNQFWGNLYIKLDGENIVKTIRILSFSLIKSYEFQVGLNEKHYIKIEKERKLFFAGFREYLGRVYVDGNLQQEFRGKLRFKEMFFK